MNLCNYRVSLAATHLSANLRVLGVAKAMLRELRDHIGFSLVLYMTHRPIDFELLTTVKSRLYDVIWRGTLITFFGAVFAGISTLSPEVEQAPALAQCLMNLIVLSRYRQ